MSLKVRIEAMKLPGHNGPALRSKFIAKPETMKKLSERVEKTLDKLA